VACKEERHRLIRPAKIGKNAQRFIYRLSQIQSFSGLVRIVLSLTWLRVVAHYRQQFLRTSNFLSFICAITILYFS
jgi:hypothetical protein